MNLALILAQAVPSSTPVTPTTVTETNISATGGIWDTVWHADPVVKFTLLLLTVLSVVCWAIIFYKFKQVKSAQKTSQQFWNIFAQSKSIQDLTTSLPMRQGPLYEIFSVGVQVASQLKKRSSGVSPREILEQKIMQVREEEIYKLEQYVPFLASTASYSPFIGLFGTVWGILMAFRHIATSGSATLQTVGPAISEALVATAVGLATAIPAVLAYNYFVNKIKTLIKMMDLYSGDLILRLDDEVIG